MELTASGVGQAPPCAFSAVGGCCNGLGAVGAGSEAVFGVYLFFFYNDAKQKKARLEKRESRKEGASDITKLHFEAKLHRAEG